MHVGQRNLKIDGKVSRISGAVAMPERERERVAVQSKVLGEWARERGWESGHK